MAALLKVRSFAPGRLNIIGEHVDYMGGEVFPAALDLGTSVEVRLHSCETDATPAPTTWTATAGSSEPWSFTPGSPCREVASWNKYVKGAVELTLQSVEAANRRQLFGAVHVHIGASTLPQGAGLSSSASLDVALVGVLLVVFDHRFDLISTPSASFDPSTLSTIALIAQQVEHQYCGVKCGIMDPFAAAHGGCFLLDCTSQSLTRIDLPRALDLMHCDMVLINSMVKHELNDGGYNRLRAALEQANDRICAATKVSSVAAEFKRLALSAVQSDAGDWTYLAALDDLVAERFFDLHQDAIKPLDLSEEQIQVVKYVGTEVVRTVAAHQLLTHANVDVAVGLGMLLNKTHDGLSNTLRVSTRELDYIQRVLTGETNGEVLGARMMGGGFGGCVLALVRRSPKQRSGDTVRNLLEPGFTKAFDLPHVDVWPVHAGCDGLRVSIDR